MADNNGTAKLLVAIIFLLLVPFAAIWRGFVLAKLWGWFITPFDVAQIGLAHAIGLSLALSMFVHASKKTETDEAGIEKLIEPAIMMALGPAMFWLFGAIIHSFM